MPFLRYSHDRRGYEHVYLIQPMTGRRGKVRSRILYWYRTPPNIKVGRDPFDEEVRRTIEQQYPDLEFDWPKLLATPKPAATSVDVERWRERRRQLKAERAAAAVEPTEEENAAGFKDQTTPLTPADEAAENDAVDQEAEEPSDQAEASQESAPILAPAESAGPGTDSPRRKRRRRRRRGTRAATAAGEVLPGADRTVEPPSTDAANDADESAADGTDRTEE